MQVNALRLKTEQYCHTHGQLCPLPGPLEVDFDVSGLPCQENSRANVNRKFFEGRTGSVYLVWARKHEANKTPLLLLENTPDSRRQLSFSSCFYSAKPSTRFEITLI